MSKEIIIDGVNVAECEFYDGCNYTTCQIGIQNYIDCDKNPNCMFKQLQRAKAENEKLKKDIHNINENCKYCDEFYMNKCNYIKKENKYKQALENIREIAKLHQYLNPELLEINGNIGQIQDLKMIEIYKKCKEVLGE